MSSESELCRAIARREFIRKAAAGTVITALAGGLYTVSGALTAKASDELRPDGRPRVPPNQRVLTALKPMGGEQGDPSRGKYRLKVHGEVDNPFEVDFRELVALGAV